MRTRSFTSLVHSTRTRKNTHSFIVQEPARTQSFTSLVHSTRTQSFTSLVHSTRTRKNTVIHITRSQYKNPQEHSHSHHSFIVQEPARTQSFTSLVHSIRTYNRLSSIAVWKSRGDRSSTTTKTMMKVGKPSNEKVGQT